MSTLEILRNNSASIELFASTQYSTNFTEGSRQFAMFQEQFISEWATPELNVGKDFSELTFLLAGYVPGYVAELTTISELRENVELMTRAKGKDFIPFLVIDNSGWDGLPLVNAIGAGVEIGRDLGYGKVRYLLPEEVIRVANGLVMLGEEGFQERLSREAENEHVNLHLDDEETQESFLEYYSEILNYYQNASAQQNAMLLYLT